jgi:hypothetical protein
VGVGVLPEQLECIFGCRRQPCVGSFHCHRSGNGRRPGGDSESRL